MNRSRTHIYSLLTLLALTSCNAKVRQDSSNNHISQEGILNKNSPKMIRTQGIPSGNVGCELQDRDGNIWFSTGGEGIYLYDGHSFTNFTTQHGLCDNDVVDIIQDKDGHILIGTRSGICKFNGKHFSHYFEADSFSQHMISSLFEDRDGNIWFGSMNNGIYRFDGKSFTNFLNDDNHSFNLGNDDQLIMDIIQDRNGNLWFSSWNRGGVWRYDGKAFINYLPSKKYYNSNGDTRAGDNSAHQVLSPFQPEPAYQSSRDSIADDMIFSMTEDKSGNIWLATRRHGACRYDGKSFTSFRENEGFVSYGVYSILEDKKGNMWFATDKNGVFRYDGKTFTNYTTKDGLINNSVFSILEDHDGNLWFGTRGFGLSRFDGETFTTFSE